MSMTEKNRKFKHLANIRFRAAQEAMRKIGDLSNKRLYEYSADEAGIVLKALQKSLEDLTERFNNEQLEEYERCLPRRTRIKTAMELG